MSWLASLCFLVQVPSPEPSDEKAQRLEAARRTIIVKEAAELGALASGLVQSGQAGDLNAIRDELARVKFPSGPTRFVPLPEMTKPREPATVGHSSEVQQIRRRSAAALYKLAREAVTSQSAQYALASFCLRGVLERDPDHKEARRLLGYVPYGGDWATPFAVSQLKQKNISHPTFGWVPEDWVPHLDRGELPAPQTKSQRKTRWLPVAEADRLRADWNPPWTINTEHFEIQTNVTLAEAISFGRRLEAFHDLFMTLLADILGENLPLIRRFKDPKLVGDGLSTTRRHQVYYFGSKAEFVDYLSPTLGPDVALNLGFYDPPKAGRGRVPAYFYRDPNGQIPEVATLYHEVSHQLLFETAGPNSYTKNTGNFWVFEGLGTYFETVVPQPDGSLEVGGLVGPRIDEALNSIVVRRRAIAIGDFVAFDEATFRDKVEIYHNYQQAMALTIFLMQWNHGAYRDRFLDYVRDAYHGRIKRSNGRSLREHLGQSYAVLDKQFLEFLKAGKATQRGSETDEVKPGDRDAIRTVPGR
jgi:hypothetical protein